MADSNKNANSSHGIKPEKITKPLQLAATIIIGAAVFDSAFLTAAGMIDHPTWIRGFLVVSAVALSAGSIYAIYSLVTKYRELLQDDAHYSKGLAGKNKGLEKQVDELSAKVSEQAALASQRLEFTQEYFVNVATRLQLPEDQAKRLGRALRESVRAGEDLVTQEMTETFLKDTWRVLSASSEESSNQLSTLVDRLATSRYEKVSEAYDYFIREDVTTVDLASHLERVASHLLGDRLQLVTPPAPVLISGTLGILDITLSEVLLNARDYSPRSSVVQIVVTRNDDSVDVAITNKLQPNTVISEEWFEPGVRGERSADAYASGAGQGLPLVRRLVSLVSGEVLLDGDAELCRVTIRFRAGTRD